MTGFPPSLSRRAARSLEHHGVTPMLGHTVVDVQPESVEIRSGDGTNRRIQTRTVVWAAGVSASPLALALGQATGADVDRAGRLAVEPDLTLPGHPEVLALGDMVRVRDPGTGEPRSLPGVAPVAMQQGRYAGRLVAERLAGKPSRPFHYHDKGTLATIGRASAVADIRGLHISGFAAWITWLVVHLFYLIGFDNRIVVLTRWAYSFFTRGHGTRLITEAAGVPPWEAAASSPGPRADQQRAQS
jgi:NADH dehydrogenase